MVEGSEHGRRRGVLTAGELSSDRIGGPVLAELGRHRQWGWRGVAGPELRAAGLEPIGAVEDLGITGLVEALPRLPAAWRLRRRLLTEVRRAELVIGIDSPDLHLGVLAAARRAGARTAQLVVPQFWAWRAKRAEQVAAVAQLSLCLWPFEVAPIRAMAGAAVCVGHPAVDRIQPVRTESEELRVLLLPGSRPHEVARHLPLFRRALAGIPHRARLVWVGEGTPRIEGVEVVPGPVDAHLDADLALVAAGTATFELALAAVPQIVVASGSPSTEWIARHVLKRERFALPNILLDRAAVPEVHGADVAALRDRIRRAADAPPFAEAAAIAEELRAALPGPGFAARVVESLEPLL